MQKALGGIDLSGLKDIHLPALPAMFPPPPIFFISLFCLLLFIVGVIFTVRQMYRLTAKKQALQKIEALKYENPYDAALIVTDLLRRLALMRFPKEKIIHLTGRQWKNFLIRTSPRKTFQGKTGMIIENVQYAPKNAFSNIDLSQLLDDCADWIRYNL